MASVGVLGMLSIMRALLLTGVLLAEAPKFGRAYRINTGDCTAILAWEALSRYMGLTSCSPAPDCSDLYGVTCSPVGRVLKMALSQIDLTGPLAPSVGNLTALRELNLDRNQMTGPIPTSWSNLGELTTLWLNINSITGTMPEEWSTGLTKLSTLDLSFLTLKGTIPSSWSELPLEYMVAVGNKLTGTLPSSWGSTNTLKTVDFSGNQLTGTLPPSWGDLTQLSLLSLKNNKQLSGTIPTTWSRIPTLTTLDISNTAVCGPLPTGWGATVSPKTLSACAQTPNTTSPGTPIPPSATSPGTPIPPSATLPGTSAPNPPTPTATGSTMGGQAGQTGNNPSSTASGKEGGGGGGGSGNKLVIIAAVVGGVGGVAVLAALVYVCVRFGGRLKPPGAADPKAAAPPPAAAAAAADAGAGAGAAVGAAVKKGGGSAAAVTDIEQPAAAAKKPAAPSLTAHLLSSVGGGRKDTSNPSDTTTTITQPNPPPTSAPDSTGSAPRSGTPTAAAAPTPSAATVVPAATANSTQRASTAPGAAPPGRSVYGQPPPNIPVVELSPTPLLLAGSGAHGAAAASATPGAGGAAAAADAVELGGAVAAVVLLPRCMQLASAIMAAGDRVVANNARCRQLVDRIAAMQPLLHSLTTTVQASSGAGGSNTDAAAQRLAPLLGNIERVLVDVHACVGSWCAPSRMGSVVTVLRNMVVSAWFKEGFLELNSHLSSALIDLTAALNIQQAHPSAQQRGSSPAQLEAEAQSSTEEDLLAVVQELVTPRQGGGAAAGGDLWSTLGDKERDALQCIFTHHGLDLPSTVRKARAEALDSRLSTLQILPSDLQIIRPLGQGGYGTVYEGLWRLTVPVAIKQLHLGFLTERARADIKREAFVHSTAHNHLNVCTLYGLVLQEAGGADTTGNSTGLITDGTASGGEREAAPATPPGAVTSSSGISIAGTGAGPGAGGLQCALVMQLHRRGSLLQLLHDDSEPLTWQRRLAMARDVAAGMAHLHHMGVVHGDLKPGNLLLADDGAVVVSDFGLAAVSSLTLATTTLRADREGADRAAEAGGLSLWYAPPELLEDPGGVKTKAGDVFAFGVVLVEIATRRWPYGFGDRYSVVRFVLGGGRPVVPADGVPEGYRELVGRCWAEDPRERPDFGWVVGRLSDIMQAVGSRVEDD